jgi:nitrogen fixation NifU-like protein
LVASKNFARYNGLKAVERFILVFLTNRGMLIYINTIQYVARLLMKNLYQERILDHYRSDRNRGTLEAPSFSSGGYNPSCGDEIVLQGMVEGDKLGRVVLEGKGCILSQAAASMLADHVRGMGINEALFLGTVVMQKLIGIEVGPTRMKCVLLPLEALQTGIKNMKKG